VLAKSDGLSSLPKRYFGLSVSGKDMGYMRLSLPAASLPLPDRVSFMGLRFDPLTPDALIGATNLHIRSGRELSYVVTPNVDHMVRLEAEPNLRPLYDDAGFMVCDSRILEILARFEGKPLPAAPGADIVEHLFRQHLEPTDKIVLIGGGPDVIEGLVRDFGFENIAWHDPPMGLRHNPDAIDAAARFIVTHNEGYAFLCVGSPQQEMVAKRAVELGGGKGVALCCGASLEFLTGQTARAPLWMRQARLEWLHRLFSEPKRLWKRYLIDGPKIFRIWLKRRGHDASA
jgi:N-acetylglucosaminyldiphosphoundecaprenol N-acetyl-beta-D-mannosaminyltransferase